MKTSLAVSCLVAASLALAACSGSSGGGTPSLAGKAVTKVASGQTTTGDATKPTGNVTWYGDYRPVITLDPVKLADYPEETAIPNMCEPMLRVQPDYKLTAGLVTKFGYRDATHYVLTVRSGVTFWDGKPMTAADVAYSLNRNLDPKVASNYAGSFAAVTKIVATNATTVTVTLKHPSAAFTTALGTLGAAVVEKAFTEKAGQSFGSPKTGVMCTGPFAFTSYDGTSKLVMTRNAHYWDTAHAAHASSFTFVYPTDPSALANGLTSGSIDGGFDLPSTILSTLKDASNGKVLLGGAGSTPINVDLLMTKKTDPAVRQALSMVIDRAGIAKTIWSGAADPLYKVAGPGLWGYAKSTYTTAYDKLKSTPDIAAAKKLVADVKTKTLVLGYPSGDTESSQLATVVQQEAAQAGITIKLNGLPNQQYGALFADPKARAPFDMIITKNYVELPEPMLMDQNYGTPPGNTNFSSYANATVTAALDKADRTTDDAQRAALVVQAEAQLAKDLPAIPIVTPRAAVFLSSKLTGATLTFSYMTSPWAAAIGGK